MSLILNSSDMPPFPLVPEWLFIKILDNMFKNLAFNTHEKQTFDFSLPISSGLAMSFTGQHMV